MNGLVCIVSVFRKQIQFQYLYWVKQESKQTCINQYSSIHTNTSWIDWYVLNTNSSYCIRIDSASAISRGNNSQCSGTNERKRRVHSLWSLKARIYNLTAELSNHTIGCASPLAGNYDTMIAIKTQIIWSHGFPEHLQITTHRQNLSAKKSTALPRIIRDNYLQYTSGI